MKKSIAEAIFRCPMCSSDDVHIVVGEDENGVIFAEDVFDARDDAICGNCHHKDEATGFILISN